MKKLSDLKDSQLVALVENRWDSSQSVWDTVEKVYDANLAVYKNDPPWLKKVPTNKSKVRANRIFVNTESVINSIIANPPKPVIISGRETPESRELALKQEKYFQIKYNERNIKEVMRKALRNLYFGRLAVIKVFWDPNLNDFNAKPIDPRKIRFSKTATKEQESEFAIECIEDTLLNVIKRFPEKRKELLEKLGFTLEDGEDIPTDVIIKNPSIEYKEAWIQDYVCFVYDDILLGKIRNPYWDWDGILITPQEEEALNESEGESRRAYMQNIKLAQGMREDPEEGEGEDVAEDANEMRAYYFNHFDMPRKPYIFATIFNNESTPIGQTDMIDQAIPLQENIDETKRDVSENAKVVNGIVKVDASVMSKEDAQKLRWQVGGVFWGKGVVPGVQRETGPALPGFVVENMIDSRREIDDIMAASSAFKGIREGQETRGGRLALIEQSFLRLNELVQVIDYLSFEMFNWFYQLAKVRYTEHHYAKTMGKEEAAQILSLVQDDFLDGTEIRVIGGKTLPEDRQFKYEQAQKDIELGILSPVDYLEAAGYDAPREKAKNRVVFDMNRPLAVGMTPEEMQAVSPPPPPGEPPKLSLSYGELPPDGKVQLAAKAGIQLNPALVVAETMKQQRDKQEEMKMKSKQGFPPKKD